MTLYVASKTKHAGMWRALRDRGYQINSTWIDEARAGESRNFSDLATRCIEEAKEADGVVLYAAAGDSLKGALLECGAALAAGRPVYYVGNSQEFSQVFAQHPLWRSVDSVEEAFALAQRNRESNLVTA